jgi:hypothetical protein
MVRVVDLFKVVHVDHQRSEGLVEPVCAWAKTPSATSMK